jgi:hypothetical protein
MPKYNEEGTSAMKDQTDDQTTQTTGRGYNRHLTDPERAATGAATDLYSPVPGDDNDTRPGMVGSSTPNVGREYRDTESRSMNAETSDWQRAYPTAPRPSSSYTMRSESKQSDGGIMRKIQDNPLAVVAAATAGGMIVGRLMRNRSHQDDRGYLRGSFGDQYGYQGYRSPEPYRQQSFYPYQSNPGGYQGYQGYNPQGGYQGAPQYRADRDFRPEQGFQGRHENFPGGSNWD